MAKARKRKIKDQPKPLEERKGELSPTPFGRQKRMMGVFFSKNFFGKRTEKEMRASLLQLPSEILEMILLEVLGGNIFHIIQCRGRLGHIRCKRYHDINHAPGADCDYDIPRECIPAHQRHRYMTWEWTRSYHARPTSLRSDSSFAILRTCRRLYNLGIPILYSHNIFDINHPETLLYLSQTIVPARFESIKYLQIDVNHAMCAYDNSAWADIVSTDVAISERPGWIKCLDLVEGMKGLENLRLRMDVEWMYGHMTYQRDDEFRLLKGMLEDLKLTSVTRLRKFDVETCGSYFGGRRAELLLDSVRGVICA